MPCTVQRIVLSILAHDAYKRKLRCLKLGCLCAADLGRHGREYTVRNALVSSRCPDLVRGPSSTGDNVNTSKGSTTPFYKSSAMCGMIFVSYSVGLCHRSEGKRRLNRNRHQQGTRALASHATAKHSLYFPLSQPHALRFALGQNEGATGPPCANRRARSRK